MAFLVGGEDVGDDLLAAQPHAAGDGLGRHAVVAGEHAHVDAELAERSDGLGARLFDLVSHGDGADKLAVLAKNSGVLPSAANCSARPAGTVTPNSSIRRTLPAAMTFCPSRAVRLVRARRQSPRPCARQFRALALGHNRLCQRVLARALQRGGQLEQRLFAHGGRAVSARGYHDIGHGRLAAGDGARLIEHHGAHAAQVLQRLGALEQNAHLGALPVPTIMATGVARPSAHGQLITSTATAEVSASLMLPVSAIHTTKVAAEITNTTGHKHAGRPCRPVEQWVPWWHWRPRRAG